MEKRQESSSYSKKIAFIACSKSKRGYSCRARDLYQGVLFGKALSYCLKRFDKVYILSAEYGLLELNDWVEPYEKTLNTMNKSERLIWADGIGRELKKKGIVGEFWFFTGTKYHEFFEGLSIGKCLQWFNTQESLRKGRGLLWEIK